MNGYCLSFRRIFVSASILALTIFGCITLSYADSPATRAARLTFMQGTVTVTEPGNAPVPAQLNLPLLSGLQLATGEDGQAEVEFEDGSVVRLTPNSALSLDNLAVDPAGIFTTDLSLLRGLAYLELRSTPQYRYSLNAGGDVVTPVENTTIRVNFDQPPAAFAVLDGTAHVDRQGSANGYASGSGYQADVRAGETLRSDATNPSRYFLTQGIDADSWDQWNDDLDQAADAQSSDSTDVRNNYAGAQGYGWSDLDANGNWYNVPGTGPVWQPYSAADDSSWDPYGNGGWMSYPGVGFVWASSYPWGWTPYRCGGWSYFNSFGWGWAPGTSCGGFGWGFAGGGGRPVNIVHAPNGYQPIRVPTPAHGPQRPWMPVGSGRGPVVASRPVDRGPRQIGGVTASPIQRGGHGFNSGGPAATSALRRDFPVDSKTRTPVLGLAGTRPANVYTIPARNNHQSLPATSASPAGQQPSYGRQPGQGQSVPSGSAVQNQRPENQQNAPFRRGAPPSSPQQSAPANGQPTIQPEHRNYIPQPAQPQPDHSQPAPQPDHRNYTPQPQPDRSQPAQQPEHRNYAPPSPQPQPDHSQPAPQPEHRNYAPPSPSPQPDHSQPAPQPEHRNFTPPPSYTPPPSQAPQQHYSPPPPPPQPHYSAPPPPPPSAPPPAQSAPARGSSPK